MKIEFVISDVGVEPLSVTTTTLIQNVKDHIDKSPYDCYTPLYREDTSIGTPGFDIVINVNNTSTGVMKDIKNLTRLVINDMSKNKEQTKYVSIDFRKTNMPLAEQNAFVTKIAEYAHENFKGNPDYVESALLVNYETTNDINADFGEVPRCTIAFHVDDCTKRYAVLSKMVMNAIITYLEELK